MIMTLDQVNRLSTAIKITQYKTIDIRQFNCKENKIAQKATFAHNTSILQHKQLTNNDAVKIISYLRDSLLHSDSKIRGHAAKALAECGYHSDKNLRELAGKTLLDIYRGTQDGQRDLRTDRQMLSTRVKVGDLVLQAMTKHDLNLSLLTREGTLPDRLKEGPTPEFSLVAKWSVQSLLEDQRNWGFSFEPTQCLELAGRYISDEKYLLDFNDVAFQNIMQKIDGRKTDCAPLDYRKVSPDEFLSNPVSRKTKKMVPTLRNAKTVGHHRTRAVLLNQTSLPMKDDILNTRKINLTGNVTLTVQQPVNDMSCEHTEKQEKSEQLSESGNHFEEKTVIVETTLLDRNTKLQPPTGELQLKKAHSLPVRTDRTQVSTTTKNNLTPTRVEQIVEKTVSQPNEKTDLISPTPEQKPTLKNRTTEPVIKKNGYERLHEDDEKSSRIRKNAFSEKNYSELEDQSLSSVRENSSDSLRKTENIPNKDNVRKNTGILERIRRIFG